MRMTMALKQKEPRGIHEALCLFLIVIALIQR